MISASTAYDRTIRNIQNNITEEMENISKEISTAIQNGKFNITVNDLSDGSKEQLEKLGYKIEFKACYHRLSCIISWEK